MTGTALLFWLVVGAVVLGIVWAYGGRRERVARGVHNTPGNTPEPAVTPGPEHDGNRPAVERGAGAKQNPADRALHEVASELTATARAVGATARSRTGVAGDTAAPRSGANTANDAAGGAQTRTTDNLPPPGAATAPGNVTLPPNLSPGGAEAAEPNRIGKGTLFGGGDLGRGHELSARNNLEPGIRPQVGGRADPNLWGEPRSFGGHEASAPGQTLGGVPGTDGNPGPAATDAGLTSAGNDQAGSALGGGATEATDAGRTGQGTTLTRPDGQGPTSGQMLAPEQPRADRP